VHKKESVSNNNDESEISGDEEKEKPKEVIGKRKREVENSEEKGKKIIQLRINK
jgi:hypothetical protein